MHKIPLLNTDIITVQKLKTTVNFFKESALSHLIRKFATILNMKYLYWLALLILTTFASAAETKPYKPQTVRDPAQYLSTDALKVSDTCPGHDILNPFTCTKDQPAGFTCFDVYRVQGDPVDTERYTLLNESLSTQELTAEPKCNFTGKLTCENFLKDLKYNLDFSWFIANFPSSSFPECGQTYTCTRIVCFAPLQDTSYGAPQAQKLDCVFKKNQIYFLGAQVTCRDKNAPTVKNK